MASTYETGHAKNVANFETLISFVTGYGAVYNPSRVSIQLASLQATADAASSLMGNVNNLLATNGNAIAARQVAFEPLKKLSTKMLNSLKATDVSKAVIENMQTLNRKIQGQRASAKTPPAVTPAPNDGQYPEGGTSPEPNAPITPTTPPTQISSAQLSFDSLLDTFDKQVKLLASIPAYAPNETELKVATLQALYQDLKTNNALVVNTNTQMSNARLSRNVIIYHPETGMVATSADVKNYIKSIFGASSAAFKQISDLSFKSVK